MTTTTATRIECDCAECGIHAARYGKTLPLAVDVPDRFMAAIPQGKRGPNKALRHTLVQQGHEQSVISAALRQRSGITPTTRRTP